MEKCCKVKLLPKFYLFIFFISAQNTKRLDKERTIVSQSTTGAAFRAARLFWAHLRSASAPSEVVAAASDPSVSPCDTDTAVDVEIRAPRRPARCF